MVAPSKRADFVIGIDTHKHTHTASIVDPLGAELATKTLPARASGYRGMVQFANSHADGHRIWAIEGSGCYGSGLSHFLLEQGELVVEIDRPERPARRNGAKSDALDATRAAREALSRRHLSQPRRRGQREALRVLLRTRQSAIEARSQAICHLKSLVVTAPLELRHRLDKLETDALVAHCKRLRALPSQSAERQATALALRATARRIQVLTEEAEELESRLDELVRFAAPRLLAETGIAAVTAAELLCAWSHRGRLRSEAAFANLAGAAPRPASSGQIVRHRLNRHGDRRLNRALHTIVLSRLAHHDETKRYAARKTAEGKTPREIKRCLKRYLARRLFKLLEAMPQPT